MVGINRKPWEVEIEILEGAKKGISKTSLFLKVRTSWTIFKSYIQKLEEESMIEISAEERRVKTGARGRLLSNNPKTVHYAKVKTTCKGKERIENLKKIYRGIKPGFFIFSIVSERGSLQLPTVQV